MKLVDTLAEQAVLEDLLESTKPPVPAECGHLHYLLFTPFRYGAPYPTGSRFRRAGFTPGVFYASDTVATAIAEMSFHRLLFYADSPGTPWPENAGEYTVFSVSYAAKAALDLSAPPLNRDRAAWMHPVDYSACQAMADAAREAAVDALRYESVRDPAPGGGTNVAIFSCKAFTARSPRTRQTWRLFLSASGVRALCDAPRQQVGFDRAAFANDPRIATMDWRR